MTNRTNAERADSVRRVLEECIRTGRDDMRWDKYSAEKMIEEAQEEMADAMLYLEVLKDKLR
jgi:hypothetical protein